MRISSLPEIFMKALPVVQTLTQTGYETYFVDGSVRDSLLNRHIHDVDIATSAYPEEVKQLFERSIDAGIQHSTVTVLYNDDSYEITTFRTESGYQDYQRPDHVEFAQNLEEDLKRRDFTINALTMDEYGSIHDSSNGLDDLNQGLIKAVGDPEKRFNEDALQMMRAVRLMSQLKFSLEEKTRQAICDHHELLSKISVEHIREEFVKMCTRPYARSTFQVFLDTQLSEEMPDFRGKKEQLSVFPSLTFSLSTEASVWTIIAILLKLPNEQIPTFMRDWKNSNQIARNVKEIVFFFDLLSDHSPSDYGLFPAGQDTVISACDVARILEQPVNSEAMINRYVALPIKNNRELVIDGSILTEWGVKPGPSLGEMLAKITEAVVDGKTANEEEAIKNFITE